jgi:cysteine desulfurase
MNCGARAYRGDLARTQVYLDWNATAPLRPQAAAAMSSTLVRCGNPSSVHRWGREARRAVERARSAVGALLKAPPEGVIFVSGGTEANHLALLGARRDRILVSAVEHDSVLRAVPEADRIPVDRDGIVLLDALDRLLAEDPRPALISVMLANNETGVVQPVAEIARIARLRGALFHCDAAQAVGKIALDAEAIGADLVTLSAHKLGGPSGVGALVVIGEPELTPLLRGGGQERGRRAGTENLVGIAGFAAAAVAAVDQISDYDRIRALRDALETGVTAVAPEAVVLCTGVPRLPNTAAVAMPGVPAETQVIAFDLDGVMVSAGAACSSGKVGPSHVLQAMGIKSDLAASTIRASLGWGSSEADIDHFLDAWAALYRRCHSLAPEVCVA